MPEQLLDRPEVGAALEHVGRGGVPQPVRPDVGSARDIRDATVHQRANGALVDPATALPVESNIVEKGQLVMHASYEYAPYGPQSLVRKRIRFERLAPGGEGERTVAVIELNNVHFSQRGRSK